jgi:hypothetical protein
VFASTGEVLILIVVVVLLIVVMRWVFKPSTPRRGIPPRSGDRGLLRPVHTTATTAEARAFRAVLSDAGIRSTMGQDADGQVEVLVFAEDLDRARSLLPPG